ncbi:MAG: FmdB family zinc ribbon protein [Dehalococcoidales bacterium]
MPIYEYECGVCKTRFERKQNFHEEPVAVCPECQGKARRVIHSVPIIFKGSGFYITDSRKNVDSEKGKEELPGREKGKGKTE